VNRPLRRSAFRAGIAAVFVLGADAPGRAALIRYEYSGTITWAAPGTGIAPGTPFSGTFAYDPASKPVSQMLEGSSQYYYGLSPTWSSAPLTDGTGITLQVGGKPVLADSGGLIVRVTEQQVAGQWGYLNADGTGLGPSTDVTISNLLRGPSAYQIDL